jgi:hypothetical protein
MGLTSLIVTKYGKVTGGAYQGYAVTHDTKRIIFTALTKKNFCFTGADVKEHKTLNSTFNSTQIEITFNNGQKSIISVVNGALGAIEGILL